MHTSRLIVALLACLFGVFGLTQAYAQDPAPQPTADGANAVGACLEADQVWLLVVDETGNVLANQCVGTPATGEAALEAAGLEIVRGSNDFLCTIGGHPATCPEPFAGQFWNYHHATAGNQWLFSNVGADTSVPEPGSIEGWCYNSPDEENCTPPLLEVIVDDQVVLGEGVSEGDLVDLEVTAEQAPGDADDAAGDGTGAAVWPWVLAGVVAVVVIGAVVIVVLRRRGTQAHGTDSNTEVSGGR